MSVKSASRPATTSSTATRASHVSAETGTGSARSASKHPSVTMNQAGADFYARKAVMFSGPDNVRDHRFPTVYDQHFVGEGYRSQEITSGVSYMFRPCPDSAFPLAKNGRIGEIGWNQEHFGTKKY